MSLAEKMRKIKEEQLKKDEEEANKKRLEEEKKKTQVKVDIPKEIVIKSKPKDEKPKIQVEQKSNSEVKMTLDGIRGLILIASGYGDKKSKKEELELKLKESLLNPKGFGDFLENLSKYLKSI